VSHPFGDLVTQHLSRKHGLSQNKLAAGIDQDPAVISAMCNGRRLSGPQSRARVVAIVGWFHDQGVLGTRTEADALLEAARMSRLDPHDVVETELLAVLSESSPGSDDATPEMAPTPPARAQRRSRRSSPLFAIALNAVVMLVIVGALLLRQRASRVTLWEERFDPLDVEQWQETHASAVWEDLPGPGAALRENHPQQDYGKAESAPMALDAQSHPVLLVKVRAVEPGASYTIQILDKVSDVSRDVLQEVVLPGEHAIDLVQAMGWQGSAICTINVWVGGESRAVTFERIAVVGDRAAGR
jgi:hypothetical protein